MKNYSIPNTTIEALALNAFVCQVTSVNQSEQPGSSQQLAPDRRPMSN